MNSFERKNLAGLYALDLRHWIEQVSHAGYLRPGVRAELETVADNLVIDAQMGIAYPTEPRRRGPEQPDTGH